MFINSEKAKIHVYLLCYNEASIIGSTLDYYTSFCSKVFLLDNMSTDDSVDIASGYENVQIIRWDSGGKLDDSKHIYLKENTFKKYSKFGGGECEEVADWIITADMDEFIFHPHLFEILAKAKSNKRTVARVIGFNMVSEAMPKPNTNLIKEIRFGKRAPMFDKPILFDPSFNITFSAGCHPKGPGFEKMLNQPDFAFFDDPVLLLHYKHLGERFVEVAIQSGSRLSELNLKRGWGSHYQKSSENLKKNTNNWKTNASEILSESGEIISDISEII